MSLILPVRSAHSATVAASFGAHAEDYEHHADLQRHIAARLASMLPVVEAPRVLELGCGTGLFSRLVVQRYPLGNFLLTDLSPAMLDQCRRNFGGGSRVRFQIMNAEEPFAPGAPFDLIVTSMTLHWLADPLTTLKRMSGLLSAHGMLLYAALGHKSFPEWEAVLKAEGLPSGVVAPPLLPGIVEQERLVPKDGALGFLRRMEAIGGLTPRIGYRPLSAGALRRALRRLDRDHGGRISWHIAYGILRAA